MAMPSTTPAIYQRGSRYGPDGVYYPAEEERTVPLSDRAITLIFYFRFALRQAFRAFPDVYVGADQFIYWEPGNTDKKIAPDGYVIRGVPSEPLRDVIRVWEEAVPSLVIEVSSKGSRSEDRGEKFYKYQDVLGCPEYLIYDDDTGELLFYRRIDGKYRAQAPGSDGRYSSHELGVQFARDPETLVRVFDLDGRPIIAPEELADRYELEQCRRRELEVENERLLAELARLRAQQ